MTPRAAIQHQRARGSVALRMGMHGVERIREAGSAKVRLPRGSREAILINTGGGLAGGDEFAFDIAAGDGAQLTVTTQAAERAYRSLGDAARVSVTLHAGKGAHLHWLPQETILFDGSSIARTITADLDEGAELLAVESVILGREASGETVRNVSFRDRWRIRRNGRLAFADDLAFSGPPPASAATLNGARAFATVVLVADDAERHLDQLCANVGEAGSASAWTGKLVARLLARDGFDLRKALIPALSALARPAGLPGVWSF
ncbi:urease accessory protein UreD [Aestuariivirga sp.]|uniref:urease accessory protein UreD n=1 Tax=Aestuariivirga sp. TaxID=2650926 RepID=UPI0039E52155